MESRRWSSHDDPHRRPSSARCPASDPDLESWRRIARTPNYSYKRGIKCQPTLALLPGRLTPAQKLEIVQSITAIHHEETGAPRYFVQVIFYDMAHANHYIAGQLAPAGQMWIRGDIRDGRSEEQKSRMLSRILQEVGRIGNIAEEEVWIYLSDIPAQNMAEYGRVLPVPGAENAWFATLPATLRERLGPLA